jgi:hypothetical protein
LGEVEPSQTQKHAGGGTGIKAAPMERSKYSRTGNKTDPYVVRAMERARNKIKDCIVQMNGKHVN